jgi:hypothetical protein
MSKELSRVERESLVGVSVEGVFEAVAKQQFVAEDLFFAIEDRLTRNVSQRPGRRQGGLGRSISHS